MRSALTVWYDSILEMSAKAEPSSPQTLQKGHIYHTGRCKQSPKAIVQEMLGRFAFLCCMQLDTEKLNIQNSHSAMDAFFFFFLSFFPDSSTSDSDSDISDFSDLSFFFFFSSGSDLSDLSPLSFFFFLSLEIVSSTSDSDSAADLSPFSFFFFFSLPSSVVKKTYIVTQENIQFEEKEQSNLTYMSNQPVYQSSWGLEVISYAPNPV